MIRFPNIKLKILNFPLFFILLLASFLRLYRIQDYMTFLGDEGRDVLVVYNILHGHLTLLGPTSSVGGFFLGPIYYYFMAPFLWLFNYNPVGPAVMVGLFGVATVFLVYKLGKEFFNKRVGLISAFLYATSPLVVSYSHSSWNPNILPFFSLLTIFALYWGVEKNNLKHFFVSGILLGICLQLHYLALFLAAVVFFYILFVQVLAQNLSFQKSLISLSKKYISIFLGFIIGWFPFLAFEIRHGFMDFKSISEFVLHSGNTGVNSNFLSTAYDVFFRIFGRLVFSFPMPEHLINFPKATVNLWVGLIVAVALASILLLFANLYKMYKEKKNNFSKFLLLSLWLFLGIILFGFYKKAIYDYYFAFMFSLPFLLVGNLINFVYKNKRLQNFGKVLAAIFLLAISFLNFADNPFIREPNRQLNQAELISKSVLEKAENKPFNFALVTGGNSDHAYRYFFTIWNNPPVTIENSVIDPKRKSVTNQLLVVCESLPCFPVGNPLWEIAGFGRAEVSGHWKVSVVEVYRLVHYKGI